MKNLSEVTSHLKKMNGIFIKKSLLKNKNISSNLNHHVDISLFKKQNIINADKKLSDSVMAGTELKLARKIQEEHLPIIGDNFNNENISVYANLKPAKEVSGDFYDVFHLTENIICFIVADVSGKGFPAAFFMAIAKTTIKNICLSGFNVTLDLLYGFNRTSELLYLVNNALEVNNMSNMFVTAFLGLYNIDNGLLYYSNAGHLPPIKLNHISGKLEDFPNEKNPVLGVFKDMEFNQNEMLLHPNETVIAYTDGIIEATDSDFNEYGTERLKNLLMTNKDNDNKTLTEKLLTDVENFQNFKLFDDATVFTLTRKK